MAGVSNLLPDVDLEKLTHLEMKKKLQGLTLEVYDEASDSMKTITIDASYSRPEEWLKTRQVPSVNISCISSQFDPDRFTTAKMRAFDGEYWHEKQYMIPVIYFYEVRFIVGLGQHMIALNEQITRRLPPMGFGSYIEVPYGGRFIECPFKLIDSKEIFARYGETEDNREFEQVYRYKLEGWRDVYPTQLVPSIKKVVVDVTVVPTHHNLTGTSTSPDPNNSVPPGSVKVNTDALE